MTIPNRKVSSVVATKRAVIFDFFHTLTARESTWGNSRPPTHAMLRVTKEAWDKQLHESSHDRLIGAQRDPFLIVAKMARAIDPRISEDAIRTATENRKARFASAVVQIPAETQRVVQSLRASGKRIGLIGNADVMEIAAWGKCPLRDLFHSTLFSCHVGYAKPDPRIYRRSLEELGVSPHETVFVGDGGSYELKGARDVGITSVMITGIIQEIWPERIPERKPDADFVIKHLGELL